MLKTTLTLLLALCLPISASAGRLIKKEISCPIGGQKFEINRTLSCSKLGQLLSLKPVTSCDFITRLPQCPNNKLPIYKDFTDVDIVELKIFMETAEYKNIREKSPYYIAYIIDKNLTSQSQETQFFLLQQGLWYSPKEQIDASYLDHYHMNTEMVLNLEDFKEKSFWRGAQAWINLQNGNLDLAKNNIEKMEPEDEKENSYLMTYKRALSYCLIAGLNDSLCTNQTKIRDHKDISKPQKE